MNEADEKRKTPSASGCDGRAFEIWRRQYEATDIFEARRQPEPAIGDGQQSQRDTGNAESRKGPVQRLQIVKDERHNGLPHDLALAVVLGYGRLGNETPDLHLQVPMP